MVKTSVDQACMLDDDYVFDIYYTNSAQVDFKTFENILAIETYRCLPSDSDPFP